VPQNSDGIVLILHYVSFVSAHLSNDREIGQQHEFSYGRAILMPTYRNFHAHDIVKIVNKLKWPRKYFRIITCNSLTNWLAG
jgi:hypothetical protein